MGFSIAGAPSVKCCLLSGSEDDGASGAGLAKRRMEEVPPVTDS